jgi:hypothetical protein
LPNRSSPPCSAKLWRRDGEWECTTEPFDRAGINRANETAQMYTVMNDEDGQRRYGLDPDGPALRIG